MENNVYYEIPISLFWFWFWLIIMGIFTLLSMGTLFFTLVVPIMIYFQLKNISYKYNNKELKIKKGLLFKSQRNIAINKIEEVNVKVGLLNLIVQAKPISLMNIKNLNQEADKFIQVWNNNR